MAVVDAEQVRAAVTVALDAAMDAMVNEIARRVVAALQAASAGGSKSAAAAARRTAPPSAYARAGSPTGRNPSGASTRCAFAPLYWDWKRADPKLNSPLRIRVRPRSQ